MTTQLEMANALLRKSEAAKIERIEQLESSLDEVAEKWAIAQVNYEDCARRNTLLEALVRDMWFKNIGRMDSCGWCVIGCDDAERCELQERMAALGLLDGDAS